MSQSEKWFPINLSIENKKCVVIGAGAVAEGKVTSLLNCGANVFLISPEVRSSIIDQYIEEGRVIFYKRKADIEDIQGAFLIICATDDYNCNKMIFEAADSKNIIVNSVDELDNSNFIFPAIYKNGDITLAVSTGGKSPLFSGVLKNILSKIVDEKYSLMADIYAKYRQKAYNEIADKEKRSAFFRFLKQLLNAENIKETHKRESEIETEFNKYR